MENETIYPFGQGGSVPSGYPIADDLNTNSAQQALSAKQGKIIGDYLFDKYVQEDISGITLSDYSLGAGTGANNKWQSGGKHKVVPVTPGEKIKLTISSTEASGGFYAFLTSAYVVPTSGSDAVPYVAGTSRVWLETSPGYVELTVPETAAYVCICPKDGDSHNSVWGVYDFVVAGMSEDYVSEDSELVNVPVGEAVDISSLTLSSYSLGETKWVGTNGAKHYVIPVTGGQKIKIRASESSNGGNFYGFLTSSYVVPTGTTTIPYVSGTGRVWIEDSWGWIELTCPADAAYLCITQTNGSGDTTVWNAIKFTDVPINEAFEDYALKKSDVVNNLYEGGVDVPLSAEQGKVLSGKISDGMPNGLTKIAYSGPIVKVADTHYVAKNKVATITSIACQGGACYGNFLFMFKENNTTCWIYNLSTNTLLQTYTIPSEERGFVSDCHCNTVNFGTEKYDADDPFPLIYVSTGNASGGYTGALVYRIVATTVDDITTYSLTLVQTLKIPDTSWSDFVVGEDGCCYISYFTTIYRMKMPKLSDGDITFDFDNALGVYKFSPKPESWNGSRGQNQMYHNGKIYMVSGVPSSSEKTLFAVLNLTTGIREVVIDLQELGLTSEPETCFIWNGHITIVFRSNANVYSLYFD